MNLESTPWYDRDLFDKRKWNIVAPLYFTYERYLDYFKPKKPCEMGSRRLIEIDLFGSSFKLTPLQFFALYYLIISYKRFVSPKELFENLYSEKVISEDYNHNIGNVISDLRKILKIEIPHEINLIESKHSFGYRFTGFDRKKTAYNKEYKKICLILES